jgi:hypothetical protein
MDLMQEPRTRSTARCVDRATECHLSAHADGWHYGLVAELEEYGIALWLRWHGTTEVALVVLPDCPVAAPGPGGDGCCLFAGHAGQHTWQDTLERGSCAS